MCQTEMHGEGGTHVDRRVLRDNQRKLKMEAVLGNVDVSDKRCTPSPQRKSILSRSQSLPGKENSPTPGASQGVVLSRLASTGSVTTPTKVDVSNQNLRYTSLSELVIVIPNSPFCRSDSFGTSSPAAPRTPMKDALVEKAVRAYLQPSESFNARTRSSGWGMCLVLNRFLPSFMTKFSIAIPNPLQFFCCAVHAFSMYMTGRRTPLPLCCPGKPRPWNWN